MNPAGASSGVDLLDNTFTGPATTDNDSHEADLVRAQRLTWPLLEHLAHGALSTSQGPRPTTDTESSYRGQLPLPKR
jgi:hypothetical protein